MCHQLFGPGHGAGSRHRRQWFHIRWLQASVRGSLDRLLLGGPGLDFRSLGFLPQLSLFGCRGSRFLRCSCIGSGPLGVLLAQPQHMNK